MNMIVDLDMTIPIDVQEAYNELGAKERNYFLNDNISDLSDGDLLDEVRKRVPNDDLIQILEESGYTVIS